MDAPAAHEAETATAAYLAAAEDPNDPGATIRVVEAATGELPRTQPSATTPAVPSESDRSGPVDTASDLEIRSVLGEGGMGIVYVAAQRSLKREVALKTIRVEHPREVAALLREAQLMGSLEHPSIVPVHALGADAHGKPLMVMKRIEGTSWQSLLDEPDHPLWERLAPEGEDRLLANLQILEQVTSAIAFAHSRGILHRDIKPANVLVGPFGEVYVADWGIALDLGGQESAKLKSPIGTPSFMAPEMAVARGSTIDARTDVYLLGATLHYALVHKPRHAGATIQEVLASAAESRPYSYDASIPATLAELANRATSRDPEDRPASALEFRDGLDEFLRHRASLGLADSAAQSLSRALELRAATAGSAEERNAQIRSLLVEARYGFNEALREWSNNPVAKAERERALAELVELEIDERHPSAARTVLKEMSAPSDELRARLAKLERELADEEAERAAARALRRDLDPTVAQRKRTAFIIVLGVLGTAITFGMRHSRLHGTNAPVPHTIVLPAVLALVLSPIAYWLRADLGKSAVNRRFLAIVYVVFGASTVLRAIAYIYQTNINQMMTFELLLIATATATLGVAFRRDFFWVSAGAVVCAFGAQRFGNWLEVFYVPPFLGLIALSALGRKTTATLAADTDARQLRR